MAEAPRAHDDSREVDGELHAQGRTDRRLPLVRNGTDDANDERVGNVAVVLSLLSVALALVLGAAARWLSDDAFISFRYARNWVEGQGLVFNVGERVEGMTNLAWTLLCGLGLLVGLEAGDAAMLMGLAAHVGVAASLGLWSLAWLRAQPQLPGLLQRWVGVLPLAALAYALHPQTAIWATGGLETSLLALCWTLAAVLLLWPSARVHARDQARAPVSPSRFGPHEFVAASLLGFAVALRPDAIVMSAALCLWPLATWPSVSVPKRVVASLAMGLPTGLVSAGLVTFRWLYYGALVPNTYFAKSAHLAWWSQGACYVGTFLQQSGALCALAVVSLALAARSSASSHVEVVRARRSAHERSAHERSAHERPDLASTSAALTQPDLVGPLRGAGVLLLGVVLYFLAIARVGGDFMYARMLVPTLPLIAVIVQVAVGSIGSRPEAAPVKQKLRLSLLGAWALVLATTRLIPTPVGTTPPTWQCGIADEWGYYSPEHQEKVERRAAIIAELIGGLDVTVAIVGAQAQDAYLARIPVAIESETGLCDAVIARQDLTTRGRVGHEKQANPHYLLAERHAQLVFGQPAFERLGLDAWIPRVVVLKDGLDAYLLVWDADLVAQLRARGAQVAPFPEMLDAFLSTADQLSADDLRRAYLQSWWFYFRVHEDPERAQRFAGLLRTHAIRVEELVGQPPEPLAALGRSGEAAADDPSD